MEMLVIAREFGGRPLKRIAIEAKDGLVYLAHPAAKEAIQKGLSSPVGFPQEDVFAYSDRGFERVCAAFERGEQEPSPWAALPRFQIKDAAN